MDETSDKIIKDEGQACRVCGCTWERACPGGCYWAEYDLCSACVGKEKVKAVDTADVRVRRRYDRLRFSIACRKLAVAEQLLREAEEKISGDIIRELRAQIVALQQIVDEEMLAMFLC